MMMMMIMRTMRRRGYSDQNKHMIGSAYSTFVKMGMQVVLDRKCEEST
jgi:hypothetical protein